MNISRFLTRRRFAMVALLVAVSVMVGCVPIRMEQSWPAVSLSDDGNVFIAYTNAVNAVDLNTGAALRLRNADGEVRLDDAGNPRVWTFTGAEGANDQFYASPVVQEDGSLLIASYTGQIYEVEPATARANPNQAVVPGQVVAQPLSEDGLLYVGIGEKNLIAYSYNGGQLDQRWEIETERGVWSHPVIVDDVLYFTSLDSALYAVNPNTGDILWQLDTQGVSASTPVIADGHIYIGSFGRKVFDISLQGEILAEYETADWVWGSPTLVDGVLYVADLSGTVYALDVSGDGFREVWKTKAASGAIRPSPLIYEEYVIVGARDHKVYWLSRDTGEVFWSREVGGEILSELLLVEPSDAINISEPYVLVSTAATPELLVAFTVNNGQRQWTFGR